MIYAHTKQHITTKYFIWNQGKINVNIVKVIHWIQDQVLFSFRRSSKKTFIILINPTQRSGYIILCADANGIPIPKASENHTLKQSLFVMWYKTLNNIKGSIDAKINIVISAPEIPQIAYGILNRIGSAGLLML